jgi:hypothetical protein
MVFARYGYYSEVFAVMLVLIPSGTHFCREPNSCAPVSWSLAHNCTLADCRWYPSA